MRSPVFGVYLTAGLMLTCVRLVGSAESEAPGADTSATPEVTATATPPITLPATAEAEFSSKARPVKEAYVESLRTLQHQYQQAALLRPAIATEKEIERFTREQTLATRDVADSPIELQAIQKTHLQKLALLRSGIAAELLNRYAPIVRQLTQAGNLERAAELDDQIEAVKSWAAPPPPDLPTTSPRADKIGGAGTMSGSSAKAVAITAPRPEYPYEARRAKVTGSGVCVLTVDSASGSVTDAHMAQSTGSRMLDDSTVAAFKRWRFKPGAVSEVRMPITYSMSGASY
jgi:TonB family protein